MHQRKYGISISSLLHPCHKIAVVCLIAHFLHRVKQNIHFGPDSVFFLFFLNNEFTIIITRFFLPKNVHKSQYDL